MTEPASTPDPTEFGVYVHIPFCAKRCDYCAFATWTDRHHLMDGYVAAVRTEIRRAVTDGMPHATSVFFGGGTPSLLPAADLLAILHEVPLADEAEVTIECNPDTVTGSLLGALWGGGVNRLSFGVQSMVPSVLAALGRTHDPANVRHSVDLALDAGFETFNLDLIYGGSGESVAEWEESVRGVLALAPPHVSAYGLTVEPGTPLASAPERHPDDDDQADKYELADELFAAHGLANYEISNWARPGHECRHNLLYWQQGDYLGFGCAAHSHRQGRRFWNVRTPDRYIELIDAGRSAEGAGEELDTEERRIEALQLSLRTRHGVPAESLDAEALDGLVARDGERIVLTRAGRLLANEVSIRLH